MQGGFEHLVGGQIGAALEAISGGVCEKLKIKQYLNENTRENLFEFCQLAFEKKELLVAAIAVCVNVFYKFH